MCRSGKSAVWIGGKFVDIDDCLTGLIKTLNDNGEVIWQSEE